MEAGTADKTQSSVDQILDVAKRQKTLLWFILFQILFTFVILFVGPPKIAGPTKLGHATAGGSVLGLVISLTLSVIGVYLIYGVGKALKMSTVSLVIIVVLMFVPCISIITLLYTNMKATKFLESNGVHVGFMGASQESLSKVRLQMEGPTNNP
jgi:hypothetical protein